MITLDADTFDTVKVNNPDDGQHNDGDVPVSDEAQHNIFDLNDAEQLRFIAEQLENASRGTTTQQPVQLEQPVPQPEEESYDYSVDDFSTSQDPSMQLKVQSMPILDNLILTTLGRGTYHDTFSIVTQPESDQGQAYRTLTSLFDQTKRLYTQDAFLSAAGLGFSKSSRYRAVIRKANLATFVSSVFGSTEVGFFHLNEYFLDSFVPEGGRLLKSQGALYLDLKTQAFISAMGQGERTKEEILDDLFPENLDYYLVSRRGSGRALSPSEQDFISRCRSRKEILAMSDSIESLSEKYIWHDFLKDVSEYVSKNCQTLTMTPQQVGSKKAKRSEAESPNMLHFPTDPTVVASPVIPQQPAGRHPEPSLGSEVPVDANLAGGNIIDAYEQARSMVDQAPSPPRPKPARNRALVGSNRRKPWSKEEENALMRGLDEVKGPRWSMILEMYGAGGKISEVLKDRNQVQLKDKARNLKLFFLKSGLDVPYYLRFVTGELKNRKRQHSADEGDQ